MWVHDRWEGKIPHLAFLLHFINNLGCSSLKVLCVYMNPLWRADLLSERGPVQAALHGNKNAHSKVAFCLYILIKGSQFLELGGYGVVSETFLEAEVDVN